MDFGAKTLNQRLTELIQRFPEVQILVLGDFILDQFIFGEISRISREAPVLILKYQETHNLPGGGANTVANVASLGASVIPMGFVGDDEWADHLFSAWPDDLNKEYVFRSSEIATTRKARVLAGSFHSFRQQVVRMDHELPFQLKPQQEDQLQKHLSKLLPQVDAVILSDYSLGNLSKRVRQTALRLAREQDKTLVVDSRDQPHLYPTATSITPNITEIESVLSSQFYSDQDQLEATGLRLVNEWQLKALLITRGKLGMSLFLSDSSHHIPIFGSDEVVDVTGAGDTVTATYTTALAVGASFREAAQLANCAAGIVVMKKGTSTVSRDELTRALENSA